MVLLIGNYLPDQQPSMLHVNEMMLQGLQAAGVKVELVRPSPLFGTLPAPGFIAKWLAYIDKFILFPFQLRRKLSGKPGVVHICDHSNAVYVGRIHSAPVIVTCHDLLAVRGGLGEETDCPASTTGRILQKWILRGLRGADVVACISRATTLDAERLVGRDNNHTRIETVPLALNYDYRQLPDSETRAVLTRIPNFDLDTPFVLHVGSNLRRKNRDGALRIFARTKDQWNGRVVFAGEPLNDELLDLAAKLGISDRVVQVAKPDGEVLRALYNRATALLFPSRFEGLGWPIIEAHACGCPALCTNSGPMPEAGGDAALYRDVDDEAGFATDLLSLTNLAERVRWSERGLKNAARFSLKEMINRYIDIYRGLGAKA